MSTPLLLRLPRPLGVGAVIVLGAACLGLAASESVPSIVRSAVLLLLVGLVLLDAFLFAGSSLPKWLVGSTIAGVALASGTVAGVSSAMQLGRFIPPAVLFGVVAARALTWRKPDAGMKRVVALCGVLVFTAAISTYSSFFPSVTLEKAVALGILMAAVYAAVRWSGHDPAALRSVFLVTYSLLVISNLLLVVLEGRSAYASSFGRFHGWTINPNTLGVLCAFAMPVLATEVLRRGAIHRTAAGVVFAGAGALLVMSGSRSGLLGAGIGLATVLRISQVARSVVFVIFSLSIVLFTPLAMRSLAESDVLAPLDRTGGSGREEVWHIAAREVRERPWTGAGFGTTEARFLLQEFGEFAVFQGAQFHNSYLEAAVELGIIGGAVVVLAGAVALSYTLRSVRVELAWAAGIAVVGAVIAIFETGLITAGSVLMFPFWVGLGVLVTAKRRGGVEQPVPAEQPRLEPVPAGV